MGTSVGLTVGTAVGVKTPGGGGVGVAASGKANAFAGVEVEDRTSCRRSCVGHHALDVGRLISNGAVGLGGLHQSPLGREDQLS